MKTAETVMEFYQCGNRVIWVPSPVVGTRVEDRLYSTVFHAFLYLLCYLCYPRCSAGT